MLISSESDGLTLEQDFAIASIAQNMRVAPREILEVEFYKALKVIYRQTNLLEKAHAAMQKGEA